MGLVLDDDTAGGPGPSKPERVADRRARRRDPRRLGGLGGGAGAAPVVLREWHRADIPALVARRSTTPRLRRLARTTSPTPTRRPTPRSTSPAPGSRSPPARRRRWPSPSTARWPVRSTSASALGRQSAEIGYWVAAAARGRGVASTAARLLSDFGFETLGLRRIELNAAVDNAASRRVAEKAGFELEGVRRPGAVAGVPTDFAVYSRIAAPPSRSASSPSGRPTGVHWPFASSATDW